VEFNYSFRSLLGVDLGATHLTVVIMNLAGQILARRYERFEVAHDPVGTASRVLALVEETTAEAGQAHTTNLGMGITIPAPLEGERLDRASGVILPAWDGYDLVGALQRALPWPVYVENDANAGAVAEKWWGQGRRFENLAYVKLGVGVGSGLILNGEIYRGSGGTAGEVGHTTINVDGPLCRCGNRGCMESYVGAPALVAEVSRLRKGRGLPAPEHGELTVGDIAAAARAGDPICVQVVERTGAYLGTALANLINLLNPELIILGGDLVAAGPHLLDAVCASVGQHAMPKAAAESQVVISQLDRDAVAVGAATIAMQNAFRPANLARTLAPKS
jgi:predicted NBD/HSP70 family sugar kinase